MATLAECKVGQRVKFKIRGKAARCENMAGKVVTATVTGVIEDMNLVSVMCDHRKLPDAVFKDMGTAVDAADLTLI